MEEQFYYRYESRRYSVTIDADMDIYGVSSAKLELFKFKLNSVTPKGVWIGTFGGKDFWINNSSKKKYAYPTKEEALDGYRKKKIAFVRHARLRLSRAEEDLRLVEGI